MTAGTDDQGAMGDRIPAIFFADVGNPVMHITASIDDRTNYWFNLGTQDPLYPAASADWWYYNPAV